MAKLAYKVVLADIAQLIVLYYVLQDLPWRAYYAATQHANAASGYAPSSTYSIFVRHFTMSGGSFPLVSPPTLDWVQLIGVALVALNGWLVYTYLRSKRAQGHLLASSE